MTEQLKISGDHLKFIFGLKIKKGRLEKAYSLKDLAEKTGLSPSYLNEIEKGKKYPKPEKIIEMARALGLSFDDLVSVKPENNSQGVASLFTSLDLKNLPLELFGITPRDIFDLTANSPDKAGALLGTLLKIARTYDMKFEHFFYAALRSYQEMHHNYFPEIEKEAERFIFENGLNEQENISPDFIREILKNKFNCRIQEQDFRLYPEIREIRSIRSAEKLLLNEQLSSTQKNFVLCREIGYQWLKLKKRPEICTGREADSFEQVLNNFKASYFAGALILRRQRLIPDLKAFFQNKNFNAKKFQQLINSYNVTPETFLYRLSEILPQEFGLKELHFLKFENFPGSNKFELIKELNMSNIAIPHGIGLNEHYCSRWLSVSLLKKLSRLQQEEDYQEALFATQHSRHLQSGKEYFCITSALPESLAGDKNISLTIGFSLNDKLRETISFWNDPKTNYQVINDTCERCQLKKEECSERVAEAVVFQSKQREKKKKEVIEKLLKER